MTRLEINLDNPGNFSYFVNMSSQSVHRMSAVVLTIVLSLCLPMAASPLHAGGSSSETISDVDVCDEGSPEIFYIFTSVPEGFYSIMNFSAVGYLGSKAEQSAVVAVVSRLEKPPAE